MRHYLTIWEYSYYDENETHTAKLERTLIYLHNPRGLEGERGWGLVSTAAFEKNSDFVKYILRTPFLIGPSFSYYQTK